MVTGDATKLALPDGPLALFLLNPFRKSREKKKTRGLEASGKSFYQSAPGNHLHLYNPLFGEEVDVWASYARELVECPRVHEPFRLSEFRPYLETGEPVTHTVPSFAGNYATH